MVDSDLIERRLGIKIKFTQRNEVKHLWEMRVMFNPTEDTSDKYAVLMYDDFYESFKCKCFIALLKERCKDRLIQ